MANEVTKIELMGPNNDGSPRSYIVASNVAIAKGTLLSLSDGRIAAASSVSSEALAGVAAMAKASDDYSTTISAWTDAIIEGFLASGAVVAGNMAVSACGAAGENLVAVGDDLASGSGVLGYFISNAGDTESTEIRMRL